MGLVEKGLADRLEWGFAPFRFVFEFLPEDFRTVIVAAVALMILLGIFHLLTR